MTSRITVFQFEQMLGSAQRLFQRGVGLIKQAGMPQCLQLHGFRCGYVTIGMPFSLALAIVGIKLVTIKLTSYRHSQCSEEIGHGLTALFTTTIVAALRSRDVKR
jgi:hypothetical protein